MKKSSLRYFVGALLIIGCFVGFIKYMLVLGANMTTDSGIVLNQFYRYSQERLYPQAHSLLTHNLQREIEVAELRKRWGLFEKSFGPIQRWEPATRGLGRGNKVSILPSYVDYTSRVYGTRGQPGQVSIRMIRENGQWRITELNIY